VSWRQKDMGLSLLSEQPRNRRSTTGPVSGFNLKLLLPGASQCVELRAARVFSLLPLGIQPAGTFQALQRSEQRARVTLKTPREICSTRRAMPNPCSGSRLRVFRINMSSVP
jgi:hypothetical protein